MCVCVCVSMSVKLQRRVDQCTVTRGSPGSEGLSDWSLQCRSRCWQHPRQQWQQLYHAWRCHMWVSKCRRVETTVVRCQPMCCTSLYKHVTQWYITKTPGQWWHWRHDNNDQNNNQTFHNTSSRHQRIQSSIKYTRFHTQLFGVIKDKFGGAFLFH